MRGSARIYDVRMAQFVLKIEQLSHIIGARGSQDLRSPSPIMAPDYTLNEKKLKSSFCFFTDGKQHKARELDMITLRNHAPRSYMTSSPVTLSAIGK